MSFGSLFSIIIAITFVNNMVLSQFLGLCPFINASDKADKAFGMGMAVTFVMTMASFATHLLHAYVLRHDAWLLQTLFAESHILRQEGVGLTPVLQTATFILVIASLVQLVEIFMRKSIPALYKSLGIFLPLITTNCAVLGVALLNTRGQLGLVESVVQGFFAGIGFTIAMLLMSGLRERLARLNVPEPLRGLPIAFICTGLLALAFMGFAGMG